MPFVGKYEALTKDSIRVALDFEKFFRSYIAGYSGVLNNRQLEYLANSGIASAAADTRSYAAIQERRREKEGRK